MGKGNPNKHLENLKGLDDILRGIYRDAHNSSTAAQIFFPDTPEKDKYNPVLFPNRDGYNTWESLLYLMNEGLVAVKSGEAGEIFSLSFEGILRLHGTTFEEEYRNKIREENASKRGQLISTIVNIISILIASAALWISIYK